MAAAVRDDSDGPLDLLSDDELSSLDGSDVVRYAAPPPVAGSSAGASKVLDPTKPPRKKPGPKPGYKRSKPAAGGQATGAPTSSAAAAKVKAATPKRRKIEDALGMTIISALEFPFEDEDPPSAGAGDFSARSASTKTGAVGGNRGGSAHPSTPGPLPLSKDGKEHPLQDFLKNPAVDLLRAPKEPAFDLRSVKTSSPRVRAYLHTRLVICLRTLT